MSIAQTRCTPLSESSLKNLPGGFSTPIRDSQLTFRRLLTAMSFPGRIVEMAPASFDPPAPLSVAAAALLTALPDAQTRVWLSADLRQSPVLPDYVRFHTGAQVIESTQCAQAELAWFSSADTADIELSAFNHGSDLNPHESATLVIDLPGFAMGHADQHAGQHLELTGPGIQSNTSISVSGLSDNFWRSRQAQQKFFPRGVDLVFASDHALFALPRTTLVEVH